MTKTKNTPRPYRDYPKPDATRSGAKVGWYYYRKLEDAEACAKAAKYNAKIAEGFGYDFGFQAPGAITRVTRAARPDEAIEPMFEVCIP